jgi:hypothetical protein
MSMVLQRKGECEISVALKYEVGDYVKKGKKGNGFVIVKLLEKKYDNWWVVDIIYDSQYMSYIDEEYKLEPGKYTYMMIPSNNKSFTTKKISYTEAVSYGI